MTEILLGILVGVVFGIMQVLVLNRVVLAVTKDENPKPGAFIWVILQFTVNIAAFVLLGFYSKTSIMVAAGCMAITAVITWVLLSKKSTGKE